MKAIVTSKGQITIPLAIRQRLDLRPGTVLEFDERADHLRAVKRMDSGDMRSVIGIAKRQLEGKTSSEWLDFLRGTPDFPPSAK
jgi:AbrB family looped-hinge helix DNA binding protein